MRKAQQKLLEAHRASQAAQSRFMTTLDTAKVEFRPANVAGNAVQNAKSKVSSAATKTSRAITSRPGTIAAVGVAIGLYLFRKPIASAVRTRLARRKETNSRSQPLVTQKQAGTGPIADPTPKTELTEEVSP